MKVWSWVRYAGVFWRVVSIDCGWANISDGVRNKRVKQDLLELIDIGDNDFKDNYPEE